MSTNAGYAAYLRSPWWRARRAETIALRGGCCEVCWRPDVKLEAHHLTYERLGAELDTDLAVLCRACHAAVHGYWDEVRDLGGDLLVEVTVRYFERAGVVMQADPSEVLAAEHADDAVWAGWDFTGAVLGAGGAAPVPSTGPVMHIREALAAVREIGDDLRWCATCGGVVLTIAGTPRRRHRTWCPEVPA